MVFNYKWDLKDKKRLKMQALQFGMDLAGVPLFCVRPPGLRVGQPGGRGCRLKQCNALGVRGRKHACLACADLFFCAWHAHILRFACAHAPV